MHIEEQAVMTNNNEDELDSRVELTEAGIVTLQLARIEAILTKDMGPTGMMTVSRSTNGTRWRILYGDRRGPSFEYAVEGETLPDAFGQLAQVLSLRHEYTTVTEVK